MAVTMEEAVEISIDEISTKTGTSISTKDAEEGYNTIIRIITNVVSNPGETKFRTLKKSNAAIQQKLMLSKGELAFSRLLVALGFTELDDSFVFTAEDPEQMSRLEGLIDVLACVAPSQTASNNSSALPNQTVDTSSSQQNQTAFPGTERSVKSSVGSSRERSPRQRDLNDDDTKSGSAKPRTALSPSTNGGGKTPDGRNFRRRDKDDNYKKATEDVQDLRAEHARRYKETTSAQNQSYLGFYPTTAQSTPDYPSADNRGSSSRNTSSAGGVSRFFSSLFGSSNASRNEETDTGCSSSNRLNNNDSRRLLNRRTSANQSSERGLRMKSLKDIQPPPQVSRGG